MEKLIFSVSPEFTIGGTRFVKTPVIWKHDDTPMIQIVREAAAGFTTEIPIYHSDGSYIAKVVGARIVNGPDAGKFNLKLRHPDKRTVCEIDGRTVFEIVREGAAALKGAAELYAPGGCFIRINESEMPREIVAADGNSLRIGGMTMVGGEIQAAIGIWTTSLGPLAIGCGSTAVRPDQLPPR